MRRRPPARRRGEPLTVRGHIVVDGFVFRVDGDLGSPGLGVTITITVDEVTA